MIHFLLCFLGSQDAKESDDESKAQHEGKNSDVSSSSQIKQNGDAKSIKQKAMWQTAKTKGNGKKCPRTSFLFNCEAVEVVLI